MRIGIDIGTTNSVVAMYTPQGPKIARGLDNSESTPSVVAITDRGVLTGRSALRQINEKPDYTFRHIKRYLGRDYHQQEHGHYQLEEGEDGKVWWRGPDRLYSGPELIAELIAALVRVAEHQTGKTPTGVVLTHPVGWKEPQLAAIREAVDIAGLENAHLLPEPIAAALAFGVDQRKFERILVYDFGGGTFDVTVLRGGDGVLKPVGDNGRENLGGADFDKRIEDAAVADFADKEGDDLRAKPHCMVHVQVEAENLKKALSEEDESNLYIPNLTTTETGFGSMNFKLTRDELEDMTADLIEDTLKATREALNQASLHPSEIGHVLLVGGMTRMPAVHHVVGVFLGDEKIRHDCEPEQAVALGAAIKGAELDGVISQTMLERMCTASIGIRRDNGAFVVAIAKGEKLPAEATLEITNALDGQEICTTSVWQGEHMEADSNVFVTAHYEDVEASDAGELTIPVTLRFDEQQRLEVLVNGQSVYASEGMSDV